MPHGKNLKKISGQKKASGKIFETLQFEITLSKTFENVVKIIIRYLSLDGCHSECHPLNLHSLYVYSWKTSQHNHTRSNRPSKLTFSYFRQNYNARSEMSSLNRRFSGSILTLRLRVTYECLSVLNIGYHVHAAFSISLISALLNTPLSHLSVPLLFALPKTNVGLSSVTGIQSLCGKPLKIF